MHCLHVWTIGSGEVSLSSHLVVDRARAPESLLHGVRTRLADDFGIAHTTIQIEPTGADGAEAACDDACEPNGALA